MMRIYLFIMLLVPSGLFSQEVTGSERNNDYFMNFIKKMSQITCFGYDVQFRQKAIFEDDTTTWQASVILQKANDSIIYIHAVDKELGDELLFFKDSGWYFTPEKRTWDFTGSGIDCLKGSRLMNFIPLNLFAIPYSESQYIPFWQVTGESGPLKTISIQIRDKPIELTDLTVQVIINEEDSLLYGIFQDADFAMYRDHQYQETIISNYYFPDNCDQSFPMSFIKYHRAIRQDSIISHDQEEDSLPMEDEMILKNIHFKTLDGQSFDLPAGLIFLDCWYVGCFPCIKSAPVIEKMNEIYGDRMQFYGVNEIDNDTNKIIRYRDKLSMSLPVLLNKDEKLSYRLTGSNAYPLFIILDGDSGKVLWHFSGYSENLEEILKNAIEEHSRNIH